MKSRRHAIVASLALATSTLVCPALAAPASPLVITTRVMVEQRRAAPDGTTRIVLAKPDRVGPGDRVVILLGYRNAGAQPLGNVALADPLPPSIAFRGPHAGSPDPEVSADGSHYGPLSGLLVPAAGGGTRPVRAADVTAVRWPLSTPLAPGGQGELAFEGTIK